MTPVPAQIGFSRFGDADWAQIRARPLTAFLPILDALRSTWGLGAGAWSRLPGGEDCAAFALDDRVVKVVPPEERTSAAREVSLLARVAGALPVPVPRLLNRVEEAGWTALLLSRIPGVLVASVWENLDETDRERLLARLGEVATAMRTVPVVATDPRPDLRARVERHGPDASAWVARWLPTGGPSVLVHGDLTGENVLVERREGRLELSGVLDFAGAFVAEAPLELVSPGVLLAQGRPRRLAAFAQSAGLDDIPERRLAWHLLHPYSKLSRDQAICGQRPDARLIDAVAIWR